MTPVLFGVTLFASAALLFVVQPMAGKDLLPHAGGTPAVWNTCLVFFQAALLLGYLYADRLARLPTRAQVGGHLAVIGVGLVAAATLRPDPDWIPGDADYPIGGLVAYLAAGVGVPFVVLSATAPLAQRWFAATGRDPYFLYAASNAGSLVGLLGYPFLVEPNLPLGQQRADWAIGFAVVAGLLALCGLPLLVRDPVVPPWLAERHRFPKEDSSPSPAPPPTRRDVLTWVGLAALPSSLLLGVTAHLTTDIAPVPLLWVVPLTLYLLSFVVVFAHWPAAARRVAGRVTPMLLVFLTVALLTGATEPLALVAGLHLAAFVAIALLCHGELAGRRPGREHLTTFYLAMSAGGVLGGLFNALVAPLLFHRLGLVEYPLAIVVAALVRPGERWRFGRADAAWVAGFAVLAAGSVLVVSRVVGLPADPRDLPVFLGRSVLVYGVPAVAAFALVRNPVRFAACLGALFLAGSLGAPAHGQTLVVVRNFFGTLRVTRSADGRFARLVHGTTLHGQQRTDQPDHPTPLMYYHPKGPVGRLFARLPAERKRRVAVVGLGCGAMAAYAEPGQEWTFYEIDPAVVRIAEDERHFTFLRDCRVRPRVVLGDARRQLAREPDGAFDLIVLDAFSSDAIPVHLLTVEALALYARKLAPQGVLAFHLSNRYLDLPPLVGRVGLAHDPPFHLRLDEDLPTDRDREAGKFPSTWAVLARDPADLGGVAKDLNWQPVPPAPGPVWRDGFSNLLAVWRSDEE